MFHPVFILIDFQILVNACGNVLDRKTSIQTVLPRTAENIAEAMEKQKLVEASNCIFDLLVGQNKNKERASLLKLLRVRPFDSLISFASFAIHEESSC